MIISIIFFSLTGWGNILERILYRIILLPVVSGVTYELIKWVGKSNNFLSKIIKENHIVNFTGHIESINNFINTLNSNKINDTELMFCQEHYIYKNFSRYNDLINKIKDNLIKSDCTINLT